jgi:hypothetical protein
MYVTRTTGERYQTERLYSQAVMHELNAILFHILSLNFMERKNGHSSQNKHGNCIVIKRIYMLLNPQCIQNR